MRCYRRIMTTCWKDKVTNAVVKDKVNRWKTAMDHVKEKAPYFVTYAGCQMTDRLVKTVLMGMVGDSRLQGMPPRR